MEEQDNLEFPLNVCGSCERRFREARLLERIDDVKQRMIDASTYSLK